MWNFINNFAQLDLRRLSALFSADYAENKAGRKANICIFTA